MTRSLSSLSLASAILLLVAPPPVTAKGGGRGGGGMGVGGSVRIGILYIPVFYFIVGGIFLFLVFLCCIWSCFFKGTGRLQRWQARLRARREQAVKAHEIREAALAGTGIKNPIPAPEGYKTVQTFEQPYQPYQPPHGDPAYQPYTYNHHGENSQSTFVIPPSGAGGAYGHAQPTPGQWTAQDETNKPFTPVPYAQGGMGYTTTNVGYGAPAHPPPSTTFPQGHGQYGGPNAV